MVRMTERVEEVVEIEGDEREEVFILLEVERAASACAVSNGTLIVGLKPLWWKRNERERWGERREERGERRDER